MVYTPPTSLEKRITVSTLNKIKQRGEKFATIALYDAAMARIAQKCGCEIVLVGDSLGMTVQGHESTLPVTLEQMAYHVAAVCRGNQKSLIVADLPFMTYATPDQALFSAAQLTQAGAHVIKLEGGEWLCETVHMLGERGIPVCAHLGLTPQSVNKFGGYMVQGRDKNQANQILKDAKALQEAGAELLVLECVPSELAKAVTQRLTIPTIGIGAGDQTDAQVLVINDLLGLTDKPPKFSKNFLLETNDIASAVLKFVTDVKAGHFPEPQHAFD